MKNKDKIRKELIKNNIFTEERINHFEERGIDLPIHTKKQWLEEGYRVKEDEEPALVLKLWKKRDTKTGRTFRLVETKLYTVMQCERIDHDMV